MSVIPEVLCLCLCQRSGQRRIQNSIAVSAAVPVSFADSFSSGVLYICSVAQFVDRISEEVDPSSAGLLRTFPPFLATSIVECMAGGISESLLTTGDALEKYQIVAQKGVIAQVPEIILRCISRDEAALAVAQKFLRVCMRMLQTVSHIKAHIKILAAIRDVCKLVVKDLTSWSLAEKGGLDLEEITAHPDFMILAAMNPVNENLCNVVMPWRLIESLDGIGRGSHVSILSVLMWNRRFNSLQYADKLPFLAGKELCDAKDIEVRRRAVENQVAELVSQTNIEEQECQAELNAYNLVISSGITNCFGKEGVLDRGNYERKHRVARLDQISLLNLYWFSLHNVHLILALNDFLANQTSPIIVLLGLSQRPTTMSLLQPMKKRWSWITMPKGSVDEEEMDNFCADLLGAAIDDTPMVDVDSHVHIDIGGGSLEDDRAEDTDTNENLETKPESLETKPESLETKPESLETEPKVSRPVRGRRVNYRAHFRLATALAEFKETYWIPDDVTLELVPLHAKAEPGPVEPSLPRQKSRRIGPITSTGHPPSSAREGTPSGHKANVDKMKAEVAKYEKEASNANAASLALKQKLDDLKAEQPGLVDAEDANGFQEGIVKATRHYKVQVESLQDKACGVGFILGLKAAAEDAEKPDSPTEIEATGDPKT
ncbi:hypothetical protein RHSIM_Rhsim03G0134900 [Rhododendron simsii]|uniref:Uncharacterized protein n=1 Tax=Rhododendron simsii TaxID=118357 RepID=A0A834HJW0_RHOSS|nr:hypothetical protein RHSIM_Rhsim03G0134900 [Rhododendron simsii]